MTNPKLGDLVRLKSGGPEMTVLSDVDTSGLPPTVACGWFARDVFISHWFTPDALNLIIPQQSSPNLDRPTGD